MQEKLLKKKPLLKGDNGNEEGLSDDDVQLTEAMTNEEEDEEDEIVFNQVPDNEKEIERNQYDYILEDL